MWVRGRREVGAGPLREREGEGEGDRSVAGLGGGGRSREYGERGKERDIIYLFIYF